MFLCLTVFLYLAGTFFFVAFCWAKAWDYREWQYSYDLFLALTGVSHFSIHYLLLWLGFKKKWLDKYIITALEILDGLVYGPVTVSLVLIVFFHIVGASVDVYFLVLLILCLGILFSRIYSSKRILDNLRCKE